MSFLPGFAPVDHEAASAAANRMNDPRITVRDDFSGASLWTARYSNKNIRASGLIPVQASLGGPRWKLPYELTIATREVAPSREVLNLRDDQDAYHVAYIRQLERIGVDNFEEKFRSIRKILGNRGIVLLCFEDLRKPGEWCHRRMFADWWLTKTGELIPEMSEYYNGGVSGGSADDIRRY